MNRAALYMVMSAAILSPACSQAEAQTAYDQYLYQTPRVSEIDEESTAELRQRLVDEIQKLLDVDEVLAPLCLAYGDIPGQAIWIYPERGRIITSLAYAYPHLPEEMQQQVVRYVRRVLADPSEQPWRPGLKQHTEGARRELHGQVYPAKDRWYPEADEYPVLHVFYGLWLYGDRTGDWAPIRQNWRHIVNAYQHYGQRENLVLYGQLSGHIGMARMAKQFNDRDTLELVETLVERDFPAAEDQQQIEDRQTQTFFAVYHDLRHRDPPRAGYFNGQPWMFLNVSPEVMRFISDDPEVREASLERYEAFTERYPVWWLAQSPYFTRWTGDESIGLATPQSIGMIFPFHRWLVETDPQQLRLFVRSSPTGIGDCHWIEAAVSAIEATGDVSWRPIDN